MLTLENILSPQMIQRIGWMLMHFTWQATIVAMVLAVLMRILRRFSANLRYIVACLGLVLIVLIPALTIGLIKVSTPVAPVHIESVIEPVATAYEAAVEAPAVASAGVAAPATAKAETLINTQPEPVYRKSGPNYKQKVVDFLEPKLDIIVTLWLLGVFVLSIWHIGGLAQLHRLKRKMVKSVDESLHSKLKELAGILGIYRVVEIMESALVRTPTVIGWLKPVILLPSSALTGLSPEQIQGILAHELAHIKRYDYMINILQTVVETLGFYHPAVWWISKKIRVERENCCDDIAVKLTGDRIGYARTLASFEDIQAGRPELAVAATGGFLFSRISRLLGKDSSKKYTLSLIPAATDIILVAALVILISNIAFCSAGQAPLQEIHCSGKVMDYEANPVARADVYMYEMHRASGETIYKQLGHTVTDSQGDYVLNGQAVDSGNIHIVAYKPGLALNYERTIDSPSTHLEMFFRLGKSDIFSGTILNQDKEPIANARVQMRLKSGTDNTLGISIPSLEDFYITTTDNQGRFSFTDVPENSSAVFLVEAPGKAGTWTLTLREDAYQPFPAGSEDIEIILKDESRIEGRVIDEDTGKGVPGVILLAVFDEDEGFYYPYRTVSNQEGFFELTGLVPDDYSVRVGATYEEMPDWVGRDVKVTVEPGQTKRNVEIPVSKGSTIEITLISQTGEPLESAQASVRQAANFGRYYCYSKTVYSDENGVATFRVPQGQCRVSAGGNLYANYSIMGDAEPINAVKGQVHKRKIILYDKPTISGIVTDQNGEPVANVLVTTKPVCEQSVMTDAQGRFEVKWYLPLYSSKKWFLWARDFENNRASLVEITEDTRTKNVTLQPAYTLSGQIVNPDGTGIPMVAVNLRTKLPGWNTIIRNIIYSDKQGRFEIKAIPALLPDFGLKLQTGAEEYFDVWDNEVVPEGNPNIPFELTPVILKPRDQTLSGIVVDANDEPAAGIGVRLQAYIPSEMSSTITDNQGRFFFDKVQRGPVSILANGGSKGFGITNAQGGDQDIKVIIGQKLIHMSTNSLLGEPLPSMDQFNVSLDRELSQNKMILLCFADIDQRPSRNTILRLNEQAQELLDRDLYIVFIQAVPVSEKKLVAWLKNNKFLPPAGMSKTSILELGSSYNWGVQSLPWLILTDKQHNVTAEGFALSELEEKISSR